MLNSVVAWHAQTQIIFYHKFQNMALICTRACRHITILNNAIVSRGFAAGSKSKKGGKVGCEDAPREVLTKEMTSNTVIGTNILKEGTDPKVMPDSDFPDWLWHLIDKRPPLSELRRRDKEMLPYEDLERFVKLDTRARIKENNAINAKN